MKVLAVIAVIIVACFAASILLGGLFYYLGKREEEMAAHFREAFDGVFWLKDHLKTEHSAAYPAVAPMLETIIDTLLDIEAKVQEIENAQKPALNDDETSDR